MADHIESQNSKSAGSFKATGQKSAIRARSDVMIELHSDIHKYTVLTNHEDHTLAAPLRMELLVQNRAWRNLDHLQTHQ